MRIRRATIWLALLGYAVVASGLPLPLGGAAPANPLSAAGKRLAAKDRSRPFPCMDRPCGCATAEQCFSNCCCNTPAELLAWARANRVEPGVIAALVRRAAVSPPVDSCCSAKRPSCREIESACCAASAKPEARTSELEPTAVAADREPSTPRSVSLRALRACRGLAAEWFMLGASLPAASTSPVLAADPIGCIECSDFSCSGSLSAPAAPPPRAA